MHAPHLSILLLSAHRRSLGGGSGRGGSCARESKAFGYEIAQCAWGRGQPFPGTPLLFTARKTRPSRLIGPSSCECTLPPPPIGSVQALATTFERHRTRTRRSAASLLKLLPMPGAVHGHRDVQCMPGTGIAPGLQHRGHRARRLICSNFVQASLDCEASDPAHSAAGGAPRGRTTSDQS